MLSVISRTEEILELVIMGKDKEIPEKVKEAIEGGADPKILLNDGMVAAMDEISARFTRGEIFVPEMMVSANAMKKGISALKPYLSEGGTAGIGTAVMATVAGDLHDIGKSLVAMMLESAGFRVVDLGCDVSAEMYVDAVRENPDTKIVGCSALLSTTMAAMKDVIDALEKAGLRKQVKVIIGGAPVTQQFCDEIGADGYSDNAAAAVRMAKEFVLG